MILSFVVNTSHFGLGWVLFLPLQAGETPLHVACSPLHSGGSSGHLQIVKLLLKQKADPKAEDKVS